MEISGCGAEVGAGESDADLPSAGLAEEPPAFEPVSELPNELPNVLPSAPPNAPPVAAAPKDAAIDPDAAEPEPGEPEAAEELELEELTGVEEPGAAGVEDEGEGEDAAACSAFSLANFLKSSALNFSIIVLFWSQSGSSRLTRSPGLNFSMIVLF